MSQRGASFLLVACLLWSSPSAAQTAAPKSSASAIVPPRKIKNVDPVYPESVQRDGTQGVVVI
jgi:hypothetical protein